MKRELLLALGVSVISIISISIGIRAEQKEQEETQTIAEYMEEFKAKQQSTEQVQQSKEVAPVQTEEVDAAGLDFTDEESQMLLKLAMAEAEDQGVIGKALVIRTVKNRVDSDEYPNSIEEVIFEPLQFSPVEDGRYYEAVPDEECYEALEMVLNYWDGTNGALFFEADWNENTWHKDNLTELFQYGNLIFYK